MMGDYYDGGWAPYVSVAERRRKAERMLATLRKKGRVCLPVAIAGRAIARTFWGKNWCDNLEAYSDYENRLPRGRSYVRNGSVIDLQIGSKNIGALVSGSDIYEVSIIVKPLEPALWQAVRDECAGKVASLVELLQGKLSGAVMEVVTRRGGGLFPTPKQLSFRCSCPDGASMCKHVAAVLYGVGSRLDSQPELLFQLRDVDPGALIRQAGSLPAAAASADPGLAGMDLSALFGIELDERPRTMHLADQDEAVPETGEAKLPAPTAAQSGLGKTITSKELGERGIPVHMRQNWLTSGVLVRTGQRGVYGVTPQTARRIARYLERAP
jgi:uncharacterized Zn finger protein